MPTMKWSATLSQQSDAKRAVQECAEQIIAELGTREPDLLALFSTGHTLDDLPGLLSDFLTPRQMIGCGAGGVIGGGHEVEHDVSLSITAALLPDVELRSFHRTPNDSLEPSELTRAIGLPTGSDANLVLLADPYTFEAESFLSTIDRVYPRSRTIGGLASGARQPGEAALFLNQEVYRSGVIGLACTGNIQVDTVVAQGCRPIGQPLFVTRANGNVIQEIDGRSPKDVLVDLYRSVNGRDRELFTHSLFLGVAMRPHDQEYRPGDFLIRNIIGLDAESGFLGVGFPVHSPMVVQFHLRDAATSHDDLDLMLRQLRTDAPPAAPAGALLFSCLGRGKHLYGEPDHDTLLFQRLVPGVPLGGFFCNGEIGPVHGQTYLHGYTSSFGIFRPRI